LIVACVRTGTKYTADYVYKLKAMVARYLPHRFICLTDRPQDLPDVETVNIGSHGLQGWWGKMCLFKPSWRLDERVLYFDLDTVICGDLTPLAALDVEFSICGNFTRAAGFTDYPCRYGSCAMNISPGFGADIWEKFLANADAHMRNACHYGDQKVIEELAPAATILQDVTPPGFFLGYRDIAETKPNGCSVVVFAGRSKPHSCETTWIREAWALC
jgi:hypothetical protein